MSTQVQKSTFLDKVHFWVVVIFFGAASCLFCVLFVPVVIFITPIFPQSQKGFIRVASSVICWVVGLKIELEGLSELNSAPNGVIVMNHQSIWDFIIVCSLYHRVGDSIHTVSRKEVLYLWPLGHAMKKAGGIFIDRNSPAGAMEHLIEESRRIFESQKDHRNKILIFPEGTRNKRLDGFLSFKKGAFKVAASLNVPVIPIVCPPQTFKRNFMFFRSATLKLKCLHPVLVDPESDLTPQVERIRSEMLDEYHKMMDEMGLKRAGN